MFALNTNKLAKVEINRIKVALAETRRKNKWLAEQIGKDESTISQWCTNARQPSLENLLKIAKILDIDIRELLYSTKNSTD
ncbi:helix-turn-helix transcriptional regulator [Aquimarina sp. RZ0]|nr:helix-turn-helix transcriptional regulator [Aquimarina sp. RZ0]KAA1242912.1 helix-turn-helix transcriptional regulator [Aquimarina sp. RZ0]